MINKVIDKIISLRGRQVIYHKYNKNALVSYVLIPKLRHGRYFVESHNNKYFCLCLIELLLEMGFNVYLHDYTDTNIDTTIRYDLFIGHSVTFSSICRMLPESCLKILLVTGSNPSFGNNQQYLRAADVERKKGIKIPAFNIVPDAYGNFKNAELIWMLGNNFVMNTWYPEFHHKVILLNNVTPITPRMRTGVNRNFLFMSSVGQVHRGLDLILDTFSICTYKVYVCSRFNDEPDFTSVYEKELFYSPNIVPVGYVNIGSSKFARIVSDSDFVILPSCSEGQSGSVVNMMALGLLPIVSENVGIPSVDEIGITIRELSIDGVAAAVDFAASMSDDEIIKKRKILLGRLKVFSGDSVKQIMSDSINMVQNDNRL